jgi:hypothetical protein
MNDPYLPPMPRALLPWNLLTLLPFPALAQPATAIVQRQLDAATDSLRHELVAVADEQAAVVAAMRSLRCDTSALWPLVEHALELRALFHAAFDSLQRRIDHVYRKDTGAQLYTDLSANDDGQRLYRRITWLSRELLSLVPPGQDAGDARAHLDRITAGLDAETWAIRTLFHVPAMALRPVLLRFALDMDRAVRAVLIAQWSGCGGT